MNQRFITNLETLDFVAEPSATGSVLLASQVNDPNLLPDELFALEAAAALKADAVYFRRFAGDRAAIPQIYLYDNTDAKFSEGDLAEIHRDLWSYSLVPMFIEIRPFDIAVYDARKPVNVLPDGTIQTTSISGRISLVSDALKLYMRAQFDSGLFWESENAKGHFLESTSAYSDLIENLKSVRRQFFKSSNLPRQTAHRILVSSILIKYLEERDNDEGLFAQDFFQKFGADDFCDVLRQPGKVVAVFDELSRHFNGKIFEWTDSEERSALESSDLRQLADFLYGNIHLDSGQYAFWRKYSFKHLPVELISSVYETFLNERRDAVYTPTFLVQTLVDEVMPSRDSDRISIRTIDISCGSGIFLVSAFRRLVQRHRYAEFRKTKKLRRLKSKALLKIIKDNIFGIDIEEDAIRLTVFSLCLALCDELKPSEIWTELKFDDTFQTNFRAENFFDFVENQEDSLNQFDLVIGNAPFVHNLAIKADDSEVYHYLEKSKDGVGRRYIRLNAEVTQKIKEDVFPQKQLALMFLDQSVKLVKNKGFVCLIMPAGPLLYNNSANFRRSFFPRHQIQEIIDLTSLDSVLFKANVPTAAILVNKCSHDKDLPIRHVTIRRTITVEQRLFFEIDKYDVHFVSQSDAINKKFVWKCNLLGGGRLHHLIDRLEELPKIKDYLASKSWACGAGYEVGPPNKQLRYAPYITDQPTLPTAALNEDGVDVSRITVERAERFHRISDEALFTPPHLLIKRNIGRRRIPTYFTDKYLTFRKIILGISGQSADREQLLEFSRAFDSHQDVYRVFISATSNEYLVGRATTLHNQDILNLPFPHDEEELDLSFVEQIISDDVLKFQVDMLTRGGKASANCRHAEPGDLKLFGDVFCRLLNSVYESSDRQFYLRGQHDLGALFAAEFDYGLAESGFGSANINTSTGDIESMVRTKFGTSAFMTKILKIYQRNKILLVKPKSLRYWLRSIALRDADESFYDLRSAGY